MHVGKQLAAMLVAMRSAGVAPEVNLGGRITHAPPPSVNHTLALKARGDVNRSPKQGYQGSYKKDLYPPKI